MCMHAVLLLAMVVNWCTEMLKGRMQMQEPVMTRLACVREGTTYSICRIDYFEELELCDCHTHQV
jgi:hypothetical protein